MISTVHTEQHSAEPRQEGPSVYDGWQRLGWGALALGACVVSALGMTWPLAANVGTTVLLGTERAATVQLFSIWTLWWTADRAALGFAHYWDAPVFYPNPGVFTYSEPEPLTGLAVAPLWGLGAPPALIHNLALLLLLTLNGVFAYRLARALSASRLPALLGAVLMVTLPYVAKHYGVLNLTPTFGMLWTLEGLVRFGRSGALRHASWAAAGFVATYLTCQQYALVFAGFAAVAGALALAQQHFAAWTAIRLGAASLVAGILVLLAAWPAFSLHSTLAFARPEFVVQGLSAQLGDFFTRPGTAWLNVPPRSWEDRAGLFPGAILLILALCGALAGWRDPARGRWTAYLAGSALVAALLAVGLNLNLAGWQPFQTLRDVLPGFAELRAPYRFAIVMQLTLPILATIALTYVKGRFGRRGAALLLVVGLLGALENLAVPGALVQLPLSPRTAWTAWLRNQPTDTVVAHIPFPDGLHVADYQIEGWRMFHQIDHRKPIVNGYSGYFPNGYTPFQLTMAQEFPGHGLLCTLDKGVRANTLVVDQPWLARHRPQMAAYTEFLSNVYADDQVQIYHLHAPEGACRTVQGTP